MPLPVHEIFVHHEGAGAPRDAFAFAAPYTLAIGLTQYKIIQSPLTDYSTLHHNHISAGVVFSGDRHHGYPVTNSDLDLLARGVRELFNKGWVASDSSVTPHRVANALSTHTVCPGDLAMNRWGDILYVIQHAIVAPGPPPPCTGDIKMKLLVPDKPLSADDGQPDFVGKSPAVAAIENSPVAFHVHSEDVDKYGGLAAFSPVPANFYKTLDIREK